MELALGSVGSRLRGSDGWTRAPKISCNGEVLIQQAGTRILRWINRCRQVSPTLFASEPRSQPPHLAARAESLPVGLHIGSAAFDRD